MSDVIPFTKPHVVGSEYGFINEAIANSELSGDGAFTKRCHALLEKSLGTKHALLTTSCTHALEMAALLLNIKEGDEVIVPAFTFVSTANAFVLRGASIKFADIDSVTLNMDPESVARLITKRTKAIVPVHYAGIACDMDKIMSLAAGHGIPVVEDNAHGLFAKHNGRYLGTIGVFGTQSFHETKNFACGEGGALLINEDRYADQAEIIREKGTDRSLFYRGMVDKYTWRAAGSSYLPSGILAAYLYAQLSARNEIQAKRHAVWATYHSELRNWANERNIQRPYLPIYALEHAAHAYWLVLPSLDARSRFIAHMAERNVKSVFHYLPLNKSPYALEKFGNQDCPVTERVADCLVRLPLFADMTEEQVARVVDAAKEFTV